MHGVHQGNLDFGNTREVALIGSYRMCYEGRKERVLKIEMDVYWQ